MHTLSNPAARRVFLHRHALAEPPTGALSDADLLALIRRLGFVQLDSVNTVERAHHMILWSRRQRYKPKALKRLLERDRDLFEHWTHDAAVIPTEFLPFWHIRFNRDAERMRSRWTRWQGPEFEAKLDDVLTHVTEHGPVGSGDVGTDEARSGGGWWEWHPSKTALEFLWRSGRLAICHRDGFAKHYDLAERVYPACDPAETQHAIDWACNAALDRLGFATSGELAAFWAKVTPAEAKDWVERELKRGSIEQISIESADGRPRTHIARPGLIDEAATLPPAPNRLRILSPFDPALRDRKRAERLFNFHYRIEIFVPEDQRTYGYYVFPVMEGERLVGRLDARARRAEGALHVTAYWPELGAPLGKGRLAKLEAELARLARFAGCETVTYAPGWQR